MKGVKGWETHAFYQLDSKIYLAHFYAAHKLHTIYFACCKSKISIKSNVWHNVCREHKQQKTTTAAAKKKKYI